MQKINNDFYSIAMNDLRFLQANADGEFYNNMATLAQQVAKKLLKSVLEVTSPSANKEINSHNLKTILNTINEEETLLNLNYKDISVLKDYYFDTRYLGADFANVTKEEISDAFEIVYNVLDEVNKFRTDKGYPVEEYEAIYPSQGKQEG